MKPVTNLLHSYWDRSGYVAKKEVLLELRKLRSTMAFDFMNNGDNYKSNNDKYFKMHQDILQAQKSLIEDSYAND